MAVISGNAVTYTSGYQEIYTGLSDSGRHESTVKVAGTHYNGKRAGALVKAAGNSNSGFSCSVDGETAPYRLVIRTGNANSGALAAGESNIASLLPWYEIKLIWDNGHLSGYYNGTLMVEMDSGDYFNAPYLGFNGYVTNTQVLEVALVAGAAIGLSVSPDPVGNFGSATAMTATGTNTAWTSGTPGSPTFTVDHGTITDQVVASATSATFTYNPGNFLGYATFTDPSTGATDIVTVTSDPVVVPPTGTVLPQDVIDYLVRSAADATEAVILNRNKTVTDRGLDLEVSTILADAHLGLYSKTGAYGGDPGAAQVLDILWQLVNGSTDPAVGPWANVSGRPLSEDLGVLLARWDTLLTANGWTLGDVINEITGTGAPQITDVLEAIAALELGGATDLTPVTDAIAALRGDTTTTVAQLLTSLGQIRTTQTYTLGDVKGWIDGLSNQQGSAILLAIAALATATGAGFTTTDAAVGGVGLGVVGVAGEVAGVVLAVADIIATLAELKAAIDNLAPPTCVGPPLLTPTSTLTYGDPVTMLIANQIDADMDGVLIDVTAKPDGVRAYPVGDFEMLFRAGYLAFITPIGYVEEPQFLSFTKGLYTPKTCTRAIGVLVKPNKGQEGTITPFTVDPA